VDGNSANKWRRVTRNDPCPICGHPDWCLVSTDGNACICPRKSDGAVRYIEDTGWLHQFDGNRSHIFSGKRRFIKSTVKVNQEKSAEKNFQRLVNQYISTVLKTDIMEIALSLGLTIESLIRLQIGWSTEHQSWSFPMYDVDGVIIGIRLRHPNGAKWAVRGSRTGIFIPQGLSETDPLLICEGPTDTAAMTDLGFNAIGRPSANGGADLILQFVQKHLYRQIVIVSDNDEHKVGQEGARRLAEELVILCRDLRIILPPAGIKDARDWKRAGITQDGVQQVIETTTKTGISIKGVIRR